MASDPLSAPHPVRQIVRLAPGRPALMLGVRTALATAVPLMLAPWIGAAAAAWASTGGFTVALADKGGSYRTRARSMGGVTIAAAVAVVAAAFAAPHVWAAAPLMLVVAALCGFAGVLGPSAAAGAVTVAVLFAVSLASPPPSATAALERGLAVAASGAWAMALALLFWPVRVYKPARYAVARVYRALDEHARKMARLADVAGSDAWIAEVTRRHGPIRDAIEQAREVLAATRRGRLGESGRGARLLVSLQLADQLFAALVALEEVLDSSPARAAAARALDGVGATLDTVADRLEPEGRLPPAPPIAWSGDDARAAGDAHAALLLARVRSYVELALETVASLHEERPPVGTPAMTLAPRADGPPAWERVRENLTFDSVLARHALRVGVTAALAVAIARAIGLQRGYWVTLTVVILLQPHRSATFTKSLQRVAGTVGGAVVAALLLSGLRSPAALLVIATVLAGVSAAVVQLNYALFSFFLTPTFVLLAELNGRDWHLAEVRIVNTIVGGALALVASRLFWPHRERDRFGDDIARVLDALADYVDATARVLLEAAPAPTLPAYRRRLGLLLNAAVASFERVLAEHSAPRAAHEPAMTLPLYVRRVGATLGAAVSVRSVAPMTIDARALATFAGAAASSLRALGATVQTGEPPAPLPPFDQLVAPFDGTLLGARLGRVAQQLGVLQAAVARGKIGSRAS